MANPMDDGTMAAKRAATPVSAEEAERFERALVYLREHFRTADLKDIAEHVGLSPFHFHRRFTLWAGRTPKTLLTELQMEHARALLLAGVRCPEVAERIGLAHASHLTHRFKLNHGGDTPTRWLKRQRVAPVSAATPPEPSPAPAAIPID